jgi:hypothetical protein
MRWYNPLSQVVTSPVREGRYAGKFTVMPGEMIHNGHRAEITHNLLDPPGGVATTWTE